MFSKMDFKQAETIEICRTCLQKITDASELYYLDVNETATIQSIRFKLEDCIPNINLNLTSNPVICKNCFEAINFMHSFKENCMQYDFYLKNYADNYRVSNIDLMELVRTNEKLWLSWVSPDVKGYMEDDNTTESYSLPIKEEPIEPIEEPVENEEDKAQSSYSCNDCNYKTTSKSKLLVHIQSHFVESTLFEIIKEEAEEEDTETDNSNDDDYVPYSQKKHVCKICKYTTDRRGKLKIHMNTHLRNKYKYEKPYKEVHPKMLKEFKCAQCTYTTACKDSLVAHVKAHSDKKRFTCTLCGYSSNQRGNLNMHSRIHTGERLFKCKFCTYSSHQKNNLKIHTMLHTGETPYSCKTCKFRTVYKHALDVHMRIHTGEKPYKCKDCDYSSIYKQSLNVHERTHLKEKPFKCEHCSYSSCQRSNLNVHLRKFHSDLVKSEDTQLSNT